MGMLKWKVALSVLLVVVIVVSLWTCHGSEGTETTPPTQVSTTTNPPQPSYAGTMEGYEYFHTNQRDRAWEEDVLFLAEQFLTGHPLLADKKFYTYTCTVEGTKMNTGTAYDNSFYSEQLREEFMACVNWLIRRIPSLSDAQIVFEMQKMIAILPDNFSFLLAHQACTARLPLFVESMTTPDGYDFLVADVPVEQEELLHTKLVSINGVSADEIALRLAAYDSGESYGQAVQHMTSYSWLTRKEVLQVVGVVGETDTEAEVVFTTGSQQITRTLPFIPDEEPLEWMDKCLFDQDIPRYRHYGERNYWYEVLDGDTMYIRFFSMSEDANQSMNDFYTEITKIMRAAETPMHVVVDFRENGGGPRVNMENLANMINQYSSGQVYILINGTTTSGGVMVSYGLSQMVDGAVLAGTPASHGSCFFAGPEILELPNSGYTFCMSTGYYKIAPENDGSPLMPELMLYQDWEDYRNGVDTVLEYVLAQ